MKKLTGMIIMAALFLSTCIPAYARPQYSEETKRLMREAQRVYLVYPHLLPAICR